ncbi:glycoside hydrolase family 9 protein [Dyadobacter bucti]|uniref:glycoside hydrolase family 9 protein n=1 Tax=Dyadobacter bucti TaxID=2572203 RepID=UPI003F6FB739
MKIRSEIILGSLLIMMQAVTAKGQSFSRDLQVSLLTNQVGYTTAAPKTCVTKGNVNRPFRVVDVLTQKVVFEGTMKTRPGDFGDYLVGDFSKLNKEGRFYLTSDTLRSYPFEIRRDPYHNAMDLIVHYFALQRCGASTTGYLSPCHLDDGKRIDTGKHQDVTGGWHDASDLRKWVGATIYGMVGLAKAYEFEKDETKRMKILDELMWGNGYFLKMQEPKGYLMDFIGGEIKQAGDSNRWTDNQIGQEEGEPHLQSPGSGKSSLKVMVIGSEDDRVIQTRPSDMISQYHFIVADAFLFRVTRPGNKEYAQKCLVAAERCFDWCVNAKTNPSPTELGASILAALELYKTTKSEKYKLYAVNQAGLLKKLQVTAGGDTLSGFFRVSSKKEEPYKNIWNGCLELISVCDLITAFPSHRDVPAWKETVVSYSRQYLAVMAGRNSFSIVPFGLYAPGEQDPGGSRKIGNYWYRYFMFPEKWWVGINANIASSGIGMAKAARILKDPELQLLAQRQLDWIVGANPFNSSTIVGVGYNQPKPYINSNEFKPATPLLPGAVMNGLGGDKDDHPVQGSGNYNISEYWTPMVAYTLWLMTELSGERQ